MKYLCCFLVLAKLFEFGLSDTETGTTTLAETKCGGKEKVSALLDVSNEFIIKAKNLYPTCIEDGKNCGRKEKSLAFLEVATNLISQVKKNYPTCPEPECPRYHDRPLDCSEILLSGKNENGVYTIWPRARVPTKKPLSVYCDMDTEGGGWTVIQRRGDFGNPKDYFYKDWQSYKVGFGKLTEDFWFGNDNIFSISNQAHYHTVRFDLKDAEGNTGYAQYRFWMDDESTNYTLHVSRYSGNVGDALSSHDNQHFSTKDHGYGMKCADIYKGAWWYYSNDCYQSNLNGIYQPGIKGWEGIIWNTWKATSLAAVEIKLRPL